MEYTGYKCLELSDEELAGVYAGTYGADAFARNEYGIILDKDQKPIEYVKFDGSRLVRVGFPTITNTMDGTIKPRNMEQVCAMDLLKDRNVPVKVLRGVYGSGKDFLMFNAAMELLEAGKFNKLVYLRPHIDVADMPALGALPGDANEKLAWTLAPLYDKTGGEFMIN